MPNWVTNNLNIAEKDLEKFKKLALDENGNIDFNILIPRPKDLDITAGYYEWNKNKRIYNEKTNKDVYNDLYTQEEFVKFVFSVPNIIQEIKETYKTDDIKDVENILKGYYNLRKYGYTSWYEWSYDKWGTKWNVNETYGSGTAFTFDTAWNVPFGWLQELSKHIDFKGSFADEDLGNNLGLFYKKNGVLQFDTLEEFNQDELYYIANLIKGWEDDTYFENIEEYAESIGFRPVSDQRRSELLNIIQDYI